MMQSIGRIVALGAMISTCLATGTACLAGSLSPEPWKAPPVERLPSQHPVVACTGDELARLQAAYRGRGPQRDLVAKVVTAATRSISRPIDFPPRGGQHNQWYQCDRCQISLRTLDASRHECPQCKTVYSGEPYDDVIFSKVHSRNLGDMENAAWAYALTGDEKYAAFAAKVLLGYAQRYRQYPYHSASRSSKSKSGGHLFEQTLNEASTLTGTIAPAYDLIHGASVLSAGDYRTIRENLILPMLENIAKNQTGKSNWQTWHNAAMLWGGAVLGDAAWVRRAISDPKNGFAYQMEVSVTGDGMWYENSWGYHFYTLSALVRIVEGARRLGIDLWSHPDLKKMFLLPVEYAMPDRSLPRLGDDVHTTISSASRMLEYAWHAYQDPSMLAYLPASPSWDSVQLGRAVGKQPPPPAQPSKVFPAAGHAILRTGGEAGLAAAITFGPYGGFHGHFDKLSFVFFGFGKELGVDPGRARSQAYRLPIHKDWYKATVGHNTVLVDRQSQRPAEGKLTAFTVAADHAAAARCEEAYPGVEHRRMLYLTERYLLVFDELIADQPRRFDWLYHNRGSAVECEAAATASSPPPDPGWEYLQNVRSGASDGAVRVRFRDKDLTTHLTLAPAAGTQVLVGDGVGGSVLDRVPLVAVGRQGRRVQFVAVLEPVPDGVSPVVAAVNVEAMQDATRITVVREGGNDLVTVKDQDFAD